MEYSFATLNACIQRVSAGSDWEVSAAPALHLVVYPGSSFDAISRDPRVSHALTRFVAVEDVCKLFRSLDVHAQALGMWMFRALYVLRFNVPLVRISLLIREVDVTVPEADGADEAGGAVHAEPDSPRYRVCSFPVLSSGNAADRVHLSPSTDILAVDVTDLEAEDLLEFKREQLGPLAATETTAGSSCRPWRPWPLLRSALEWALGLVLAGAVAALFRGQGVVCSL